MSRVEELLAQPRGANSTVVFHPGYDEAFAADTRDAYNALPWYKKLLYKLGLLNDFK